MRLLKIRSIAVFCIVAALLSLSIVRVAALSNVFPPVTPGVAVNRVNITVSVSPEPQNGAVGVAAGNPSGNGGTMQRIARVNETTDPVYRRNITLISQQPDGPGELGSAPIVKDNNLFPNVSAATTSTGSEGMVGSGTSGPAISDVSDPVTPNPAGGTNNDNGKSDPCAQYADAKHLEEWQNCKDQNGASAPAGFDAAGKKTDQLADYLSQLVKKLAEGQNALTCIFGGC
jgi:hypothetical protein